MRKITLLLVMLISATCLNAQQKKGALLHDKFKGNVALSGEDYANTTLILEHKQYADMGSFELEEVYPGSKFDKPAVITTSGDWTVLKGSATNENATVVELNANGGRILYFLRLKNGNLQHLDVSLHEIKPVAKHMLRKQ